MTNAKAQKCIEENLKCHSHFALCLDCKMESPPRLIMCYYTPFVHQLFALKARSL